MESKSLKIVVKIGTSSLTIPDTGHLALATVAHLVEVLCQLRHQGIQVVLVSSGAVGVGAARLGLTSRPQYLALKQAVAAVGQGVDLRTGERLTIALDETGQLDTLQLSLDAVRTLHARREANRLIAQVDALPTEQRQRCLSAVINPSLRAATRAAGIPDAIANRALAVFRPQVDLARTLRTGDRLTVLFEQTWVQDRVVATGDLLAVAIVNGKRRYSAVRYTDRDGKTAYYTPDAEPLARRQLALLRAPLVYTRVSSGFSTRRWHPILRYSRPHYGVDFAAPAGRAVVASGDGTVVFQGRKDGYGNALIIRHGKRYQTVYGHLSRFAREVRFNGTVKRGQVIGYVGATGLATGPHLHYELHVDNRPVDPLTADLPFIEPLDEGEKARFKRSIKPLLAELRRQDEALLAATR